MFSMEVSSGFLSTKLPADLVSTTELKLKTSYQWQPLQTFVTISEHFMVKAKGIRFRGTLEDCNSVLEQLLYQVCSRDSKLLQYHFFAGSGLIPSFTVSLTDYFRTISQYCLAKLQCNNYVFRIYSDHKLIILFHKTAHNQQKEVERSEITFDYPSLFQMMACMLFPDLPLNFFFLQS